ncbi:glia maturation factor gamma isoform X1 [Dendrobates tinctorius]|uniref:glia maturation factor gamma isoform X1 n=2 Tax=Dendrobates tinctorius TaxID=92724 RepID=UPI003CC9370B
MPSAEPSRLITTQDCQQFRCVLCSMSDGTAREGIHHSRTENLQDKRAAPLSASVGLQSTRGNSQSDSLVVCDVDSDLREKLRKFRFRKETNNAAIMMKIDKEKQLVVLEEEFEDISPDDLQNELPERQPRFLVYSYRYVHDDGRISYPLCMIFSSPVGCKPEQQMMYAGSKNRLVQIAELTKVFEIRSTSDLTEEWLKERLSFFR